MAKQQAAVNVPPESGPSPRRRHPRLYGYLAGLGVFVLVAVPAAWSALAAVASFSGCFLSCSEPTPVAGVFWTLSALVLLALPVIAGVLTARAVSGRPGSVRALKIFALAILLGMAVLRLIPVVNGAF